MCQALYTELSQYTEANVSLKTKKGGLDMFSLFTHLFTSI